MKSSNHEFEMYVLVGHKPIKEYYHEQSTFVEGRSGSEYTIRLRNGTSSRACFVLAVDGLSVLDGQECSDTSSGYVLSAGETLDVICYKVDEGTGAKFMFGAKDESYSAEMGKGTDNVGVIAAKVFREKQRPSFNVALWYSGTRHDGYDQPKKTMGDFGHHGDLSWTRNTGPRFGSTSIRAASAISAGPPRGIVSSGPTRSVNTSVEVKTSGGMIGSNTIEQQSLDAADMEETKLGTVFGESVRWNTTKINFERANKHADASMVIYYDTKKNLERRGIKFHKETAPLPNPFPGNEPGCPTPPKWRRR